MPSKLKVKAGPNGPVFMEGFSRRRLDENGQDMTVIAGDVAVEVPNTRYYRRRIDKGDLIRVFETAGDAKARVKKE